MKRYLGAGLAAGQSLVLALAVLAPGCRDKEAARAERPSATGPRAAAADRLPTDEELMAYLTWLRDWRLLTLRNKEELDATTERVSELRGTPWPTPARSWRASGDARRLRANRREQQGALRHEAQRPDHRRDTGVAGGPRAEHPAVRLLRASATRRRWRRHAACMATPRWTGSSHARPPWPPRSAPTGS